MIGFFVCAALLVALTLGVLAWSVLRAPADPIAADGPAGGLANGLADNLAAGAAGSGADGRADAQRDANVAIAREQLAALDAARAADDIDERAYADERERLERSLAGSLDTAPARRGHRGAAIAVAGLVAVGVPIATGVLYLELGQPEAMALGPQSRGAGTQEAAAQQGQDPGVASAGGTQGQAGQAGQAAQAAQAAQAGQAGQADPQAPALAELLPQLEAKLAERPDDLEGWRLLGRTYLNIEEFDKAAKALEHARGLAPDDVDLLASLAEARAMRAGGVLTGDALEPLERAHDLDPMHEQTLWLLGIARQEAGEHEAAVELFSTLRGIAVGTGNEQAVATIDQYLSRSRAALGLGPVASGPIAAPPTAAGPAAPVAPAAGIADGAPVTGGTTGVATTGGNAVTVDVSLSAEAAAAVDPSQSVFVFARAADGPPMPLAVARLTVADLPATVRLDESMAMMPTMTLATFPTVTVGARVSASGQPAAAPGDWFDERADVTPSTAPELNLVIDRQVR